MTRYAIVCIVCSLLVGLGRTATFVERMRNMVLPTENHPLVLVPGDGGSQLVAKLNKPTVVHYFCQKKTSDYFDLWVNLELMVPYVLDCWVDNMRLVYDNETRTTSGPPGVEVKVPGFGNTSTVEWLDPSQVSPSAYFTKIVDEFLALGYQRGVNLRGAPYDFRKAPSENLGVVVINPLTVRPEQRSQPSLAYMMPDRLFWKDDEVLVSTLKKNYTLANYSTFFEDIGFSDGYEMYKDTRSYMLDPSPPGVEVHCLHGRNVSTIERIEYHKPGFPDIQPEVVYGDGDGTVNIRSLLGCLNFRGRQSQPVHIKALDNVEHMSILYERAAIDYIKTIALGH